MSKVQPKWSTLTAGQRWYLVWLAGNLLLGLAALLVILFSV